jgi:hypothetical protein
MGKAAPSAVSDIRLTTAAVWGTTVLATRALDDGQSLELGSSPSALVSAPDHAQIVDVPIRAIAGGWQLDARGASGGSVTLRGRQEDPRDLGMAGTPVAIVPGDHGLVQYGSFSHAGSVLRSRLTAPATRARAKGAGLRLRETP